MQQLPVRFHGAIEHDDRVRCGVPMALGLNVRRVANQVMLGAGFWIFVQQSQTARAVVDDQ
jgi:hypothetical protein